MTTIEKLLSGGLAGIGIFFLCGKFYAMHARNCELEERNRELEERNRELQNELCQEQERCKEQEEYKHFWWKRTRELEDQISRSNTNYVLATSMLEDHGVDFLAENI